MSGEVSFAQFAGTNIQYFEHAVNNNFYFIELNK